MMSSGKVILGALAGVAAGALLGILFAPEKGSQTRKKLARSGNDYVDGLGEKFNTFIDGMSSKLETLKKDANYIAEQGKQKIDKAENDLTGAVRHKMHEMTNKS